MSPDLQLSSAGLSGAAWTRRYTDAVTAKNWRDEVPRKRVKIWTQDAVVMADWKDPKLMLPDRLCHIVTQAF